MPLKKDQKIEIVKEFGSNEKDTGSTEVQIALLTTRILELTEHFKILENRLRNYVNETNKNLPGNKLNSLYDETKSYGSSILFD